MGDMKALAGGGRARVLIWSIATIRRGVRQAPLSLALVAALWTVGAGTGSVLHGPPGRLGRATLFDTSHSLDRPLSLVLSLLWAPGLDAYVASTVLLLTLGVFAEQRLGTARYGLAVLGTQVIAVVSLGASTWWLSRVYPDWAQAFLSVRYGGPAVGVVGAVLAASARLPTLWRRRVRVGAVTLLATMVLFDGGGIAVLLLVAALAGLILGRLTHRRAPAGSPVGSIHESRMLAALIVGATALGPLLAALSPTPTGPFAVLGYLVAPVRGPHPDVVAQLCAETPASLACTVGRLHLAPSLGVVVMAALPSLLLLLAADGIRRGRRMAWVASVALEGALVAVAVANYFLILADASTVPAAVSLADEQPVLLFTQLVLPCVVPVTVAIFVLVLGRGLFTVRAPKGCYRVMGARLAVLAVACAATYVGLGLLVSDQWAGAPSAWSLLGDFPLRLAPLELTLGLFPTHLPTRPAATVLFDWIGVLFWSATAIMTTRSFRRDARPTGGDVARARRTLLARGGSSIAAMGLWPGNDYWFSPDGSSYVPYRVINGVALTTGDPVGPAPERGTVVVAFAAFCESRGWVPCFYSATAGLEGVCAVRGWSSVQVAEEAVLILGAVTFTGKRFQDIRTAMNKATRERLRVEWIDYPSAPLSTVLQIQAISEEWVAQQSLPEMGFTLGGLEQLSDPDVRCSVVMDESGGVHAVASWLPIHDGDASVSGWTLDFMRRRSDGFRHAVEVLIAQAALDFQAQGYAVLSLSGAPLARAEGKPTGPAGRRTTPAGPDALERLLDLVGTRLEPVYGFRSLLRFKAKFQPEYQPMYLIYADPTSLPAIARAVAKAYVPTASLGSLVRILNGLNDRRPSRRQPDRRGRRTKPASDRRPPATATPPAADAVRPPPLARAGRRP